MTMVVLLEMEQALEDRWRTTPCHEDRVEISRLALWCIRGFCTALRGEEMLTVDLARTAQSLAKLEGGSDGAKSYFWFEMRGKVPEGLGSGGAR